MRARESYNRKIPGKIIPMRAQCVCALYLKDLTNDENNESINAE